jgi:RimJ/RimL family protein N-acetyltransferase
LTAVPLVTLEPWAADDLPLLERLLGDPAMMLHLGGPESAEKIAERNGRYAEPDSKQFKIVAGGEGVGWVGYWERGPENYEIGWSVLPAHQGRGFAKAGTRAALDRARAEHDRRYVHAYPAVDNGPSNGICRSLGFTLLGAYDFEYPKGHLLRCNDWRLDLFSSSRRG